MSHSRLFSSRQFSSSLTRVRRQLDQFSSVHYINTWLCFLLTIQHIPRAEVN
uniref:Uncharacterized protein n=1 Tax=Anopheles dirus TaxID=7168 RepID=A0A182NYA5_9DIPT